MKITLKLENFKEEPKLFLMEVDPDVSISDLKGKIKAKIKINFGNQVLVLSSCKCILHEDRTLSDYEIPEGGVIIVYEKSRSRSMPIYVRTVGAANSILSLFVNPLDSISEIKSDIFDKIGIPIGNQLLVFAGRKLINTSLLALNNIAFETTIYLITLDKPNS